MNPPSSLMPRIANTMADNSAQGGGGGSGSQDSDASGGAPGGQATPRAEGRRTGFTVKSNVKQGADGFEDVDDFWGNENDDSLDLSVLNTTAEVPRPAPATPVDARGTGTKVRARVVCAARMCVVVLGLCAVVWGWWDEVRWSARAWVGVLGGAAVASVLAMMRPASFFRETW